MTAEIEYLTTTEYAAKLGVHRSRVQALVRQGRIPGAKKVGRDWIIPAGVWPTPGERGPKARWETDEK